MLNAYSNAQTISATNGIIPFTSVSLVKGQTVELSGTSTILLHKAGIYLVNMVVAGTPAAAGAVTVSMTKDGVTQPQATLTDPTALTTVGVTMPISTLVQVQDSDGCCCCKAPVVLQFTNTGVGLNNANAILTITKVC